MASSFKLEGARPKPPPPPLRLQKSPLNSTQTGNNQLLYDLPTTSSLSSPPPNNRIVSSPTRPTGQSRIRAADRSRGLSPPPPPSHGRTTPTFFGDNELEQFALTCRAWYYDQDDNAGRQMTQTLANIPSSQRANYVRVQASIRAAYHTYLAARRRTEFQAHLSATVPGGSLPAHSRVQSSGSIAKRERKDRFDRFVKAWCNPGMPGTKPFFESLWAIMRLQIVPENLGGAGSRRIEWEFDDAVFMESAGKEFMLEAIDVLKGVLGFEEKQNTRTASLRLSSDTIVSQLHSRSQSEPLSSLFSAPASSQKPVLGKQSRRSRAPSDPFLDSNMPITSTSQRNNISSTQEAKRRPDHPEVHEGALLNSSLPSKVQIDALLTRTAGGERRYALPSESGDGCESLRIWTVPDLSNPEFISLLSSFPTFLARRALPRFPADPRVKRAGLDLEEGEYNETDDVRNELRFGTGVMWVGKKERSGSWRGSWWERFMAWWRRIAC